METNSNILVTGQVVYASINGNSTTAIFGGLERPTKLQRQLLTQQEERDFADDYDNILLNVAKTNPKLSNTSRIEFGTETTIIARKTVNLVLLLLLEAIFGGIVWFIVQVRI